MVAGMDDFLRIENLVQHLGGRRVLDNVTLSVRRGEIFSLLGPSGCGKTTLLRLLAGFLQPDQGRLLLDGRDLAALPPERRPVNTVFQNYALFPHLSVAQNIAFGLKYEQRLSREEIDRRVGDMLELVRLSDCATRRPEALSGGQKQRVALARALVKAPAVLLLDEPLAALDLQLRQALLEELRSLQRQLGTTFIFVTHDQTEAMRLSDRMAVMHQGRLGQVGTPQEMYAEPASAFVARFIGDGNLIPATCQGSQAAGHLILETRDGMRLLAKSQGGVVTGQCCELLIRPEQVRLVASGMGRMDDAEANQMTGCLVACQSLGPRMRVQIRVAETLWIADISAADAVRLKASQAGDPVSFEVRAEDLRVLPRSD